MVHNALEQTEEQNVQRVCMFLARRAAWHQSLLLQRRKASWAHARQVVPDFGDMCALPRYMHHLNHVSFRLSGRVRVLCLCTEVLLLSWGRSDCRVA